MKTEKVTSKNAAKLPMAHGVGRRKSAVARVWLRKGSGKIVVNGKDYTQYFDTAISRMEASTPLNVCKDVVVGLDFEVNVNGSGLPAQAGAVKLGISRALVSFNEELRPTLRQFGLLTVDSRLKERKKYGQKAARRKFQFVKR